VENVEKKNIEKENTEKSQFQRLQTIMSASLCDLLSYFKHQWMYGVFLNSNV